MNQTNKVIALEARLRDCRNVRTLGVRTNFADYSPEEAALIRNARKIYYPTTFYADLFDAMGKKTFPSYHTYKCVQDKIMQTALFELQELPHPRTRVFYGTRQKKSISDYFKFPFIAKIPRGSAMGRGVFLIHDQHELEAYLEQTDAAYIQEYMPVDRDMRIVIIGHRLVHAYWRVAAQMNFAPMLPSEEPYVWIRYRIKPGNWPWIRQVPADGMMSASIFVNTKINCMCLKAI
jgi:ribosomal protein S6--L-glutamate ligase